MQVIPAQLAMTLMLGLGLPVLAGERTLFVDKVDAGAEGKNYTKVNSDVSLLINNGNAPIVRVLEPPLAPSATGAFAWNSGTYRKPSVLGITASHKERYGQVFLQVARPTPGEGWLEVAVLGEAGAETNVPELEWDEAKEFRQLAPKGPNLIWDVNGLFRRLTPVGQLITREEYPTNALHSVTMNYDIETRVFEVWLGSDQIISDAKFASGAFGKEATVLILAGSCWAANPQTGSLIAQWHWKASDTPFKECFKPKK